jgi:hypothetical protein
VKEYEIEVRDGILDIEFVHVAENPKVSALQIERLSSLTEEDQS